VLEMLVSNSPKPPWVRILLPLIVLIVFSLVQSISFFQASPAGSGIQLPFWNSISADPYETRIFALQLTALVLLTALLFRYANTERRLRRLINTIIAIAVVSAVFGLLRQTMQHQTGFGLPLLQTGIGYGQFINKNHFAYLMEMGFGLSLGLIFASGVRRDRAMIYLAVLLPIWMALVLANSRGGILAMVVQLGVTLLMFPSIATRSNRGRVWSFVRSPVVRIVVVLSLIGLCAIAVFWVGGDRLATSIEESRSEFPGARASRVGATRLEIWQATLRMCKDNPIAGVGMGGYWAAIPLYHVASGNLTPQQAHNDYLELLSSGGIVGLAIGLWFAFTVFSRANENLRSPDRFRRAACFASLIAIAGVAVHSLVDFGLHRMLNAMIFAALIVIATSNVNSDSKTLKDNAEN
jgi:O-antigen ligase